MVVFTNPRARMFAGVLNLVLGIVFVASAPAAGSAGPAVAVAVIGAVLVIMGARWSYAFSIAVRPPHLVLRYPIRTKLIRLDDVAYLEPHVGSEGLIYLRAYLHVVMKDGTRRPFSAVQWSPRDSTGVQEASEVMNDAIRTART